RACPPSPMLDRFVVLDGVSAHPVAVTPLTEAAASAAESALLLTDSSRHLAYAVAPHAVTVFSSATGARVGGYPLPGALRWSRPASGILDSTRGILFLAGAGHLAALAAPSRRLLTLHTV